MENIGFLFSEKQENFKLLSRKELLKGTLKEAYNELEKLIEEIGEEKEIAFLLIVKGDRDNPKTILEVYEKKEG
jgi:hypothetical protein